jgi:hypothetical protein
VLAVVTKFSFFILDVRKETFEIEKNLRRHFAIKDVVKGSEEQKEDESMFRNVFFFDLANVFHYNVQFIVRNLFPSLSIFSLILRRKTKMEKLAPSYIKRLFSTIDFSLV